MALSGGKYGDGLSECCLFIPSCPVCASVVEGLDGPHSCLPVLVAEVIANCVGFSPGAEQTAEVALGFDVFEGEEQHDAEQYHTFPHHLVVSAPAQPTLHEEQEIGHVVGHLGSGSGCSIFIFNQSVVELSGHADDHVIEVAA